MSTTTGTVKWFNESKGFGFIEMSSEKEAKEAMKTLNGKELDGRTIVVDEAKPQAPRDDSRGGGGGGYNRN